MCNGKLKVCLLFFPLSWEFEKKKMSFTEKKNLKRAAVYLFFKVLLSSRNSS